MSCITGIAILDNRYPLYIRGYLKFLSIVRDHEGDTAKAKVSDAHNE